MSECFFWFTQLFFQALESRPCYSSCYPKISLTFESFCTSINVGVTVFGDQARYSVKCQGEVPPLHTSLAFGSFQATNRKPSNICQHIKQCQGGKYCTNTTQIQRPEAAWRSGITIQLGCSPVQCTSLSAC